MNNVVRNFIRNVATQDLDFEPLFVENMLDYVNQLEVTTKTRKPAKKAKQKKILEEKARAVNPTFGNLVVAVNEIDDSINKFVKSLFADDENNFPLLQQDDTEDFNFEEEDYE